MRAVRGAQINILNERDFLQNMPCAPPLQLQGLLLAYPIGD